MKKGRIIANIIIIIAFITAVFFIGWVQILVRPGKCGVFVSKTNGISENLVESGKFSWKWQRLLPTNAELRVFSLAPQTISKKSSGSLPSSEIYSKQIKDNPDFTYEINYEFQLKVKKEELVNLVKEMNVRKDEDVTAYFNNMVNVASQKLTDYIFEKARASSQFTVDTISQQDIFNLIEENTADYKAIELVSAKIVSSRLPDFYLYEKAKAAYDGYLDSLAADLKKIASEDAQKIADDERAMKRLEKFADLIEKHPQLQEVFKSSDATAVMNALKDF